MYARVSRYEVPLGKVDEDARGAADTARKVEEMPGSLGLYYLSDRATGKTMSITLWEDAQAMTDSEMPANTLRDQTSSAASAKIVSVERYEVVVHPSPVLAGRA